MWLISLLFIYFFDVCEKVFVEICNSVATEQKLGVEEEMTANKVGS